jgi:hypothetical protein
MASAELGEHREDRALGAAADQGVLDLEVDDGVDGVGAPDGVDADLGQPDVADVAGLHQIGDGADRVLDGRGRIEAGRPVDVDVVDAEAGQGVGRARS